MIDIGEGVTGEIVGEGRLVMPDLDAPHPNMILNEPSIVFTTTTDDERSMLTGRPRYRIMKRYKICGGMYRPEWDPEFIAMLDRENAKPLELNRIRS